MPNYAVQSPTNPMRGIFRGDVGYSFGALTPATIAASPGGLSRAANGVVTLTTAAPHNFVPGETLTIVDSGPATGGLIVAVGGTRFGANYMILTVPSTTTATLLPLDEIVLHQAPDTGGGGRAVSIAAESPAVPQAGKAFALANIGDPSMQPYAFFADGAFLAAPGVFEVDIQVAAVDADIEYQTMLNGNITTVDPTNFTFHLDAPLTGAKFVRALLKARANAGVGLVLRFRG